MEARPATDCADWRDLLDLRAVTTISTAIDELAAFEVLDASVMRVVALCDDPEAGATELVAVLERDGPFAANLLHLANSAAHPAPIRARTVRQAVMLVGRRQLRRLAIETAAVRLLDRVRGAGGARHGELHAQALATAAVAAATAQAAHAPADPVHLAGLLLDIGRLVLPRAFGEEACDALGADPSAAAERAAFGIDHAQAGALLCDRWNLPDDVVELVAWHHGGPGAATSPSAETACAQLAALVVGMLAGHEPDPALLACALRATGLDLDELDDLASHALPGGGEADVGRRVAELERLARTDELTGLATRSHWILATDAVLGRAEAGCVLLLDVDGLARINARHGRNAGDLVLVALARLAQSRGVAGRFGGDELAIWIPGTPGDARTAAEHLIALTAEMFEPGSGPQVDVSIGIAATQHHGFDLEALLVAADRGLLDAKRAGRSRTSLAA